MWSCDLIISPFWRWIVVCVLYLSVMCRPHIIVGVYEVCVCVCGGGESLPAYLSLLQGKRFHKRTKLQQVAHIHHFSFSLISSYVLHSNTIFSMTLQLITRVEKWHCSVQNCCSHKHLLKCVLELGRRHFESGDLTEVESMKLLLEFSLLPPWQLARAVCLTSSRVYWLRGPWCSFTCLTWSSWIWACTDDWFPRYNTHKWLGSHLGGKLLFELTIRRIALQKPFG